MLNDTVKFMTITVGHVQKHNPCRLLWSLSSTILLINAVIFVSKLSTYLPFLKYATVGYDVTLNGIIGRVNEEDKYAYITESDEVNIDVLYDDFQVIWDVSLNVNNSEMVALLGPNGSGKSTVLNTVSNLFLTVSKSPLDSI